MTNDMLSATGMDQVMDNMNDMMKNIMPAKKKKKRVTVTEARDILAEEEAEKLIDEDLVAQEAHRAGGKPRHHLYRRDRQDRRNECERRRRRRFPRRRTARHSADRRRQRREDQVWSDQNRPHPLHCCRRLPCEQAGGSHSRAAGAFSLQSAACTPWTSTILSASSPRQSIPCRKNTKPYWLLTIQH